MGKHRSSLAPVAVKVAPKKKGHYKSACHTLMVEIWGTGREGNSQAYTWLKNTFGQQIHFSEIDDEVRLKEIWEKLYTYSFIAAPKEDL